MANEDLKKTKKQKRGGFGPMMNQGIDKPEDMKGALSKLLKYIKPYRVAIFFVVLFTIASTVFTIISPKMLGNMTNDIVEDYIQIRAYDEVVENLPEGVTLEDGSFMVDPALLDPVSQSEMMAEMPADLPLGYEIPPIEITIDKILENLPEDQKEMLSDEMVEVLREIDFSERPTIGFDAVLETIMVLISIYLLSLVFSYIQGWIITDVTQKIVYNLRKELSEKIHKLPLKYYDDRNIGDVMSIVSNDIDTISQSLNQSLSQIISSVAMVIGILYMMFSISWQMTLVAILVLPISMIVVSIVVKASQKYFMQQQEVLGDLNGQIEETFTGHLLVKSFNREDKEIKKFMKDNIRLHNSGWKSQFLSGLMFPIIMLVGNIGYVGIAVLGGWLAVQGTVNVGDIQAFLQYMSQFNQPIRQTATIANVLQSTAAASERVFELLEAEDEKSDDKDAKVIDTVKGEVQFEQVSFSYDSETDVIKNFDADIKAGQRVAIVGPTGAGKTTMVNLLMRFYDVKSGYIKIDGMKLEEMTRSSLRELFGMVLQDTWLFSGTVRENLKYGRPEATDEEMIAAVEATYVDHIIDSLPDGYDMVLDEDAENLSSGEKQLITIARAMLVDSPILILDEATSSVDTRTEALIQKAMDKLMDGRTSFVIAHRLSTIKTADLILVMKDGNIIEKGSHDELIKADGFYADLYNSQFEG